MRICRRGITRLVIILNRVVIKIPNFTCQWNHFLTGLLANMTEAEVYRYSLLELPEYGYSRLLCPVVWSSWGGWILIQRRCQPFGWDDEVDISEHIEKFPGDDKITNYGLLDGKVVKFDYGSLSL